MAACQSYLQFALFSCFVYFQQHLLWILIIFLKMCSPPSVGSIILKGASMKHHEQVPLGSPFEQESATLELLIAHGNLQNPLEKCVFPVYGPSWGALFSIICSTACIWAGLSSFSSSFFHNFMKKCSPPSVGSTFLKIDPHHFASKIPLFGPPAGGQND